MKRYFKCTECAVLDKSHECYCDKPCYMKIIDGKKIILGNLQESWNEAEVVGDLDNYCRGTGRRREVPRKFRIMSYNDFVLENL